MGTLKIIIDNLKFILTAVVVVLIMLLLRQCESTTKAKDEILRLKNNQTALEDKIRNFKDENGYLVGQVKGFVYTIDELKDSLDYEKDKPPVSIIKYVTEIKEVIVTKTVVKTIGENSDGTILHSLEIKDSADFGKSHRNISVKLPVWCDSTIKAGDAEITLQQKIWLNASLYQDIKTKEVMVELKTDYQGVTFNTAQGVIIKRDDAFKQFSKTQRKQFGLGLQFGAGLAGNNISPYIGVGIQYTPRFLQW